MKLNSGVDYRGILTHTVFTQLLGEEMSHKDGEKRRSFVRSFVCACVTHATLVHINRGVVRDIDTSSSSFLSPKQEF